jgi:hypothetical protein
MRPCDNQLGGRLLVGRFFFASLKIAPASRTIRFCSVLEEPSLKYRWQIAVLVGCVRTL